MSDPNDKKPQSPASNWSDFERQARENKDAAPVMEDPLAELDRIVSSGDFGSGDGPRRGSTVTDDDLRILEQELIKELRGQHDEAGPMASASAGQPAAPQGEAPRVDVPEHDPMARPLPQSQGRPQQPVQHSPVSDPRAAMDSGNGYEPRYSAPEEPVSPDPRGYAQEPAAPQAPMPSSECPAERGSGLDDWSSLFDDIAPSAPAPSAPVAETEPSRRPAEPVDDELPVATSGSYGQLSRRSTEKDDSFFTGLRATRDQDDSLSLPAQSEESPHAPEVSLGEQRSPSFRSGRSYDEGAAGPQYGRQPEPAAPRAPLIDPLAGYTPEAVDTPVEPAPEPVMPSSWSDRRPSEPVVDPMQGYRPNDPSAGAADVRYGDAQAPRYAPDPTPVSEPDPYDVYQGTQRSPAASAGYRQPAEEPAAPRGLRQDPFAVFNDPSAPQSNEPYMPYREPEPAAPVAPGVNVAGQQDDYANYGTEPSYRAPDTQSYDQGYVPGQGGYQDPVGNDFAATDAPVYGSYADPNIAQAAAESVPNYQDEDYTTLETAAAMAAPQPKRKSRKGLYMAAAAAGVVVVGGLLVWGFGGSGGGSTETPIIEANTDPVKETPDDPGGKVVPHQDQTVYDRIDGTESDEGPSNMMPATETPMDITTNGQSPRVIPLSGGESSVSQSSGSGDTDSGAVAPKKVRTVVVRPDGTFVTSEEPAANGTNQNTQLSSVDQQLLNATPSEQAMSQTNNRDINGNQLNGGAVSSAQPVVDENMPLPQSKPAELVNLQAAAQNSVSQPVPAAPRQSSQAPLVLTPTAPATNPVPAQTIAAPSGNGGYTVQVTSQRTPEQARASYANIQAQLSSVLAGYQPDIKQADLGARGIYYRVRVGSFADQAGAINFCNRIKAAGGDCLVARQ
nr:SPOR domain-containing protein [uncultured Cohaesibacter sp.]